MMFRLHALAPVSDIPVSKNSQASRYENFHGGTPLFFYVLVRA